MFDQLKKDIGKLSIKRPMNKKKGIRFATEKLCNDYNNINRECLSFVLGSDVNRACLIIKNVFFDSVVIPALARKIRYELFLDLNRIPHPKIVTDITSSCLILGMSYSSIVHRLFMTQLTIIVGL